MPMKQKKYEKVLQVSTYHISNDIMTQQIVT